VRWDLRSETWSKTAVLTRDSDPVLLESVTNQSSCSCVRSQLVNECQPNSEKSAKRSSTWKWRLTVTVSMLIYCLMACCSTRERRLRRRSTKLVRAPAQLLVRRHFADRQRRSWRRRGQRRRRAAGSAARRRRARPRRQRPPTARHRPRTSSNGPRRSERWARLRLMKWAYRQITRNWILLISPTLYGNVRKITRNDQNGKPEEASTHNSAKIHASNVFVIGDHDLWPFDLKINEFHNSSWNISV